VYSLSVHHNCLENPTQTSSLTVTYTQFRLWQQTSIGNHTVDAHCFSERPVNRSGWLQSGSPFRIGRPYCFAATFSILLDANKDGKITFDEWFNHSPVRSTGDYIRWQDLFDASWSNRSRHRMEKDRQAILLSHWFCRIQHSTGVHEIEIDLPEALIQHLNWNKYS